MKVSRREAAFYCIVISGLFLLWMFAPAIKVSSRMSETIVKADHGALEWRDDRGVTLRVEYLAEKEDFERRKVVLPARLLNRFLSDYSVFSLEVRVASKADVYFLNVPAHIDSFVRDDRGNRYETKNRCVCMRANGKDATGLLTVFEKTIFNHRPFTASDSVVSGLLVFEKIDSKAQKATLEIPHVYDAESGDSETAAFSFDVSERMHGRHF